MNFDDVIKQTGLAVVSVEVAGLGEVEIYPFSGALFHQMATQSSKPVRDENGELLDVTTHEEEKTDFYYAVYALKGSEPSGADVEKLSHAVTPAQATDIVRAAVGLDGVDEAGKS